MDRHSGLSTGFPPMWPGFDSGLDTMWVEFIGCLKALISKKDWIELILSKSRSDFPQLFNDPALVRAYDHRNVD